MKKSILLFFLIAVLLISCKGEKTVLVLSSDKGIEANASGGRRSSTIIVRENLMESLMEVSGLDEEALAVDLFGVLDVTVADGRDFLSRERIYAALENNIGVENKIEALRKERKELKDSSFLTSMDNLSKGYDSTLLEAAKKNRKEYVVYDASEAVGEKIEGEEDLLFLKSWIKAIIS